ncbi:hypothetical protein VTI74DRAFT_8932 [Chaetomium olivicolor]
MRLLRRRADDAAKDHSCQPQLPTRGLVLPMPRHQRPESQGLLPASRGRRAIPLLAPHASPGAHIPLRHVFDRLLLGPAWAMPRVSHRPVPGVDPTQAPKLLELALVGGSSFVGADPGPGAAPCRLVPRARVRYQRARAVEIEMAATQGVQRSSTLSVGAMGHINTWRCQGPGSGRSRPRN